MKNVRIYIFVMYKKLYYFGLYICIMWENVVFWEVFKISNYIN